MYMLQQLTDSTAIRRRWQIPLSSVANAQCIICHVASDESRIKGLLRHVNVAVYIQAAWQRVVINSESIAVAAL